MLFPFRQNRLFLSVANVLFIYDAHQSSQLRHGEYTAYVSRLRSRYKNAKSLLTRGGSDLLWSTYEVYSPVHDRMIMESAEWQTERRHACSIFGTYMKRWMIKFVLSGSKWEGSGALSMSGGRVGVCSSREGSVKLLSAEGNDDDRP
jgi:hypothetical protein